jgi:flagellar hook-length control protein FliK
MMSSDLLTNINSIVTAKNVESKVKKSDDASIISNKVGQNNLTSVSENKVSNDNENKFEKVLNKLETRKNNCTKTSDKTFKINDESDKEIEEKIEKLNDEQLMQCINLLVEFLNSRLNDDSSFVENNQMSGVSENLGIDLMKLIDSNELIDQMSLLQQSNDSLLDNSKNVFNDLLNALNNSEVMEDVDLETLQIAEKLLNQISEQINNENLNMADDKTALAKAVNESLNRINELLNDKANNNDYELSLQNNSLNNIYKVMKNSDASDSSDSQNYSSEQSKDEKVLQSILGKSKDDIKVPVFTTTTTVVNNATGAVVETQQTVNVKTMATDIVQNVKYMAANDMRELVVKVNPGNLGEITIRLIEENGDMKLHMKAMSKETYSLLVQQSSDIKSQLSDQNIKIHDVNISLYEEDTTFFKEGEFSRSFEGQSGNKGNSDKADVNDNEDLEEDDYDSTSALNMLV